MNYLLILLIVIILHKSCVRKKKEHLIGSSCGTDSQCGYGQRCRMFTCKWSPGRCYNNQHCTIRKKGNYCVNYKCIGCSDTPYTPYTCPSNQNKDHCLNKKCVQCKDDTHCIKPFVCNKNKNCASSCTEDVDCEKEGVGDNKGKYKCDIENQSCYLPPAKFNWILVLIIVAVILCIAGIYIWLKKYKSCTIDANCTWIARHCNLSTNKCFTQ